MHRQLNDYKNWHVIKAEISVCHHNFCEVIKENKAKTLVELIRYIKCSQNKKKILFDEEAPRCDFLL